MISFSSSIQPYTYEREKKFTVILHFPHLTKDQRNSCSEYIKQEMIMFDTNVESKNIVDILICMIFVESHSVEIENYQIKGYQSVR